MHIVRIELSLDKQINHLFTHLHDEAAVVFWANLDKQDDEMAFYSDCEEWQGAYSGSGEPAHLCAGQYVYAALYSLLCVGDSKPTPRHKLERTCKNNRCVSNKHLYWCLGEKTT